MERIAIKIYEAWLFSSGWDVRAEINKWNTEIEFTFPELAAEDRSQKLKDLALAESMDWVSHEDAQAIAGKELNITTYDPETTTAEIQAEKNIMINKGFEQVQKNVAQEDKTMNEEVI
jgi:hypothetical protein